MHVEFIGLPGSGKTTSRRRLVSGFTCAGESRYFSSEHAYLDVAKNKIDPVFRLPLKILPRKQAIDLCMRLSHRSVRQEEAKTEFLANYGAALCAFMGSETCREMSEVDRNRVIGSFLVSGAFWQFINVPQMSDKVVLFEEGLVQKSFMFVDRVQSRATDQSRVFEYLENIPRPDLVVYVRASIDEAAQRMMSRPEGLTDRLKQADEATIRKFLESAQAHLDLISSWLAEHRPGVLVELENYDGAPDALDRVRSRIENL